MQYTFFTYITTHTCSIKKCSINSLREKILSQKKHIPILLCWAWLCLVSGREFVSRLNTHLPTSINNERNMCAHNPKEENVGEQKRMRALVEPGAYFFIHERRKWFPQWKLRNDLSVSKRRAGKKHKKGEQDNTHLLSGTSNPFSSEKRENPGKRAEGFHSTFSCSSFARHK